MTTICLILIGDALALVGGWGPVGALVNTGNNTVYEMANGRPDDGGSVQDPFAAGGGT